MSSEIRSTDPLSDWPVLNTNGHIWLQIRNKCNIIAIILFRVFYCLIWNRNCFLFLWIDENFQYFKTFFVIYVSPNYKLFWNIETKSFSKYFFIVSLSCLIYQAKLQKLLFAALLFKSVFFSFFRINTNLYSKH